MKNNIQRKILLIVFVLLLAIPVQAAFAISIDTQPPTVSGSSLRFKHTYNLNDIPTGKVLEFVVYSKSVSTGNLVATSWVSKISGGNSGPAFYVWDQAANQERWVKVYLSSSADTTNQRRQESNVVYACHVESTGSYDCGTGVSTPPAPSTGGSLSLNLMTVPDGNGNVTLSWSPVDGAAGYQVIQNGNVVENLTQNTSVTIPDNGQVRVIAFDEHSKVITSEEMQLGDAPGPIDPTNPNDWEQCANQICQCIQSLKPTLDQIQQALGDVLSKMADLISAVNGVRDSVDAVKQQLVPTQSYPVNTVDSYNLPTIETNKPLMHESGKFQDNTTYFSDKGDAAEPPAFNSAPEPATKWKDANGNEVSKENTLQKEPPKQRETVKDRAPVPTREPPPARDLTDYRQKLRWQSDQYKP